MAYVLHTCKSQLYFVEILEMSLLFCEKIIIVTIKNGNAATDIEDCLNALRQEVICSLQQHHHYCEDPQLCLL